MSGSRHLLTLSFDALQILCVHLHLILQHLVTDRNCVNYTTHRDSIIHNMQHKVHNTGRDTSVQRSPASQNKAAVGTDSRLARDPVEGLFQPTA